MYVEKFSAGNPEKNHEDNEDTTILFWVLSLQKWNIGNVRLKCAQLEFEPEFLPQTYERIANIVLLYNTLPIEEYLNLIAHELSLH